MSEDLKKLIPGDYGRFHFTLQKKKHLQAMGFDLMAMVVETDPKYLLLRDNDGIEYLPKRSDIDVFEKSEKYEFNTK
jgi:hypothetical protein